MITQQWHQVYNQVQVMHKVLLAIVVKAEKDNNGDENDSLSQSTSTHVGFAVRKVKS